MIPKTHQEMLALQEALNKNVLFKYLDDKTRSDIFDVMEPKDYKPGENIIVQGYIFDLLILCNPSLKLGRSRCGASGHFCGFSLNCLKKNNEKLEKKPL